MTLAFPPFGTVGSTEPPAVGLTIDAATWRWDGNSGSVFVCSGFPLQPGQVTSSNLSTVQVFVAGVEQAIGITPLDGAFPDGSYRSISLQFNYTLTNNTPVSAEVRINQSTRNTVDMAWVEPTYATHIIKKAVIAPTDPEHLCGTFVTLAPLTPATNDTGTDALWAAEIENAWNNYSGVKTGASPGSAIYDHQNGLWALYCRTGTRAYYQWAYDWSTEFTQGSIIATGVDIDHPANGDYHLLLPFTLPKAADYATCTGYADWNPEHFGGFESGSCGQPGEPYTLRLVSCASGYWMIGWRQFKRHLARKVNQALSTLYVTSYATAKDYWLSSLYGVRYNFGVTGLWALLLGYLTGCTSEFSIPTGVPAAASIDYEIKLPWIIDALIDQQWALGDYRDGLTGARSGALDGGVTLVDGGFGNFQLSITTEFLMAYYDHVYPDSRIPPLIKTICDYMIAEARPQTTFDNTYPDSPYVTPYNNLDPAFVVTSTFVMTTTSGSPTGTWTGGPVPAAWLIGQTIRASGISDLIVQSVFGSTVTFYANASASGSRTFQVAMSGYYLAMFAPTFAWYYAYSGTATYNTWATRASVVSMMVNTATKNWGENFGGMRQAFLYYRHGGTVRGTTGVHPTVIVNPPDQPVLG